MLWSVVTAEPVTPPAAPGSSIGARVSSSSSVWSPSTCCVEPMATRAPSLRNSLLPASTSRTFTSASVQRSVTPNFVTISTHRQVHRSRTPDWSRIDSAADTSFTAPSLTPGRFVA